MKIVISGSHGLIGSALASALAADGHRVIRLLRPPFAAGDDRIGWDPAAGVIDRTALEGLDAVVHLAGESVASGRWTSAKKARIRDSRVGGTRLLARALADLAHRPRALVCASAVGYYGSRHEQILVEESAPGLGFLADVCREWEAAAEPAREAGIRVVHLRTGLVLTSAGGVLAKLLPIFRLGLGGRLGGGHQWMSWITLDDAVRAIAYALRRDTLRGPLNLVSPQPVTNREFTEILGQVLRRPTIVAVPAVVLRAVLGEAAGEMLGSQRAHPTKLLAEEFAFLHPELEPALRHLLRGEPRVPAPA
ncbi:MAG TPA: TIGR01777 family oxidoreductase [bacterium]|nr:TIGR01777 family oxidoreductase [bacterium]